MAETDRHQLALAYNAVVSSGSTRTNSVRLETLAGWTRVVRSVAKNLSGGFSLTGGETVANYTYYST